MSTISYIKKFTSVLIAFFAVAFAPELCFAQTQQAAQAATQSPTAQVAAEQKTDSQQLLEKIKYNGDEDRHNLRVLARSTVRFVHDNISPDLADILAKKVCGVRVISPVLGLILIFAAWALQHFFIAFIFNLIFRTKNKETVKASRLLLAKLRHPISWFVILVATDAAVLLLSHSPDFTFTVRRISTVFFFVLLCWVLRIISDAFFKMLEERMTVQYAATKNLLDLGSRITKYAIYTFTFLVVLDTLGANITAVVASLGIGGAALAFASKDTIANFFGSMSLIMDKPFMVGDWITTVGIEGTVEYIGFRSTRIRTFPRTVVSIPNSVLANATVENWSKRNKRRVTMTIGLTYDTTADQLEQIVGDIKKLLRENPKVDSSDIRVSFANFGESSLDISILYYVFDLNAIPFGERVQEINLAIMRAVQSRGLSFAFPSRSLYVETMPKAEK